MLQFIHLIFVETLVVILCVRSLTFKY